MSVKYLYLRLRNKFHKIIHKGREAYPWMLYEEIEVIEDILKKVKPMNCLEWGAGASTTYFPRFLGAKSQWLSIEHDKEWVLKLKGFISQKNTLLVHVPHNRFPWTDQNGDGSYDDLKDYIELPVKYQRFDFILIDGRARSECLKKAFEIITDNGIVIMHDARREYYHEFFKLFKNQMYLKNEMGHGKDMWIGSKERDMRKLIDQEKFSRTSAAYSQLRVSFNDLSR